jgi:hypothetical protein
MRWELDSFSTATIHERLWPFGTKNFGCELPNFVDKLVADLDENVTDEASGSGYFSFWQSIEYMEGIGVPRNARHHFVAIGAQSFSCSCQLTHEE